MTGTLQPLDSKFAIVDNRGNPTEYFTRWAQQKQIDIGDSITSAQATAILVAYLAAHPLIAGTGIQLTPDGNITDGVTIHADVQAILDEITATRGAILYRGLLGWAALLPGTAGKFLQTAGAGADPLWATAGGGGSANPWWWTPPLAATFPTLVSFDATLPTVTDSTNTGMKLLWPSNYGTSDQSRGCFKALPAATDWTVTAHWHTLAVDSNFTYGGPCIRNAAANRTLTYAKNNYASDSSHSIIGQTANTGQGLLNASLSTGLNLHPMHMRLRYTTATGILACDLSYDGEDWIQQDSRNVNALLSAAPDQIGFKLHAGAGVAAAAGQFPFMKIDRWVQSF